MFSAVYTTWLDLKGWLLCSLILRASLIYCAGTNDSNWPTVLSDGKYRLNHQRLLEYTHIFFVDNFIL